MIPPIVDTRKKSVNYGGIFVRKNRYSKQIMRQVTGQYCEMIHIHIR